MLKKLRKFGLGHCDLPTMVWNVSFMLRLLTLNIDRRVKHGIPIISYIVTLIFGIAYVYVYLISWFWFVFVWSPHYGEVFCAIIVFSLGITSEVGATKIICMFIYQKTVRDIVDGYLACDARVVPGSRFANNLSKTLRAVKRRAIIFWIVIVGNGTMYIIQTALKPGRHMMEDCFILYGLQPMFESPHFEIGFTANSLSIYFSCYLLANITAFFIVVTGYTEAQMLALAEQLLLVWEDAQTHYREIIEIDIEGGHEVKKEDNTEKDKIINVYVKDHLLKIVNIHSENLNLLRQVEKVFRGAIAAEFVIIIVGLIAQLLGGLEKTYIQIPFSLMLVYMDCLVGQRVSEASFDFETAIYDCKWENFDTPNRKIVLLMLLSAQKGMTMSAGGVATLNYSCFMATIRNIYSAYTTLRSTM